MAGVFPGSSGISKAMITKCWIFTYDTINISLYIILFIVLFPSFDQVPCFFEVKLAFHFAGGEAVGDSGYLLCWPRLSRGLFQSHGGGGGGGVIKKLRSIESSHIFQAAFT